jgi:hypothetical protein
MSVSEIAREPSVRSSAQVEPGSNAGRRLRLRRPAEQALDGGREQDLARVERGGRGACRHERQHHQLAPGAEVLRTSVDPVVERHAQLAALARPDHPERPLLRVIDGRDVRGRRLGGRVEGQRRAQALAVGALHDQLDPWNVHVCARRISASIG